MQATWSGSSLEAYCNQVETCTKIALSCTENDSHRRPSIKDIVDMLKESEIKVAKVINIIIYFWQAEGSDDLLIWSGHHFTTFAIMCTIFFSSFLRIVVQLYRSLLGFKCLLITYSGLLSSKLDKHVVC